MTEPVLCFDFSLGQCTRTGSWEELAAGAYQAIHASSTRETQRRPPS